MSKRNYGKAISQPKQIVFPFNAFTTKFGGCVSKIITPVKVSKAFDPQVTSPDGITNYETKALWDTGATNSVVTEATAHQLGLIPIGSAVVNHAGGSSTKNRYLVNVVLPNNVGIVGVMVSDMPENTGEFGILIGMDIISQGDFSISNLNNTTWVSFRIPSYKTADFVAESYRVAFQGIKPYQPCPCGSRDASGKPILFRDCHGKA